MAKRTRDVPVLFWVSPQEMELIRQKMAQFGTDNLSAYLRKMAIDGYVLQLDLPELKELVSLLRRSSNNLNQLMRPGAFMTRTWRICGRGMSACGQRRGMCSPSFPSCNKLKKIRRNFRRISAATMRSENPWVSAGTPCAIISSLRNCGRSLWTR